MKKYWFRLMVALLIVGCPEALFAQATLNGERDAQQLRGELSQLLSRQAEIRIRLYELDHELKPENIERYFAGMGSVHPEQLRETRRAKLQIEKDRLEAQLVELEQALPRLQAQIVSADARASQRSVLGSASLTLQNRLGTVTTAIVLLLVVIIPALVVLGIVVAAKRSRPVSRPPRSVL